METLIQITGVQYACGEANVHDLMAEIEQEKPEVLLVTEQTHDYGIIVRALVGTAYRGVVSRFDLEEVLRIMRHNDTAVLVGKVADTDSEGRCYNIRISGDYPTPGDNTESTPDIWSDWHWTGAPLLDNNPEDCRLDISLKVALTELRRSGSMNKQTLLEHLALILQLAKWDVSHETQQQLSQIRQMVSRHDDPDIRALAPQLRRTLTALGSTERTRQFQETYLPHLCQSTEAERMYLQWYAIHRTELSNIHLWQPTIEKQLEAIETCLIQLPADLCYQKDDFGALMHRLLYADVPRRKLLMLLSAIVLRRQLRKLLGLDEDITDNDDHMLLLKLAPIFYGDIDNARAFLLLVKDQRATDITYLVCLWIKEKRICPSHCRRPLWTLLHEAGIYKPTESNWNMQIDIRKALR